MQNNTRFSGEIVVVSPSFAFTMVADSSVELPDFYFHSHNIPPSNWKRAPVHVVLRIRSLHQVGNYREG